MNNAEFINKAKYIVAKYTNENILKPEQGLISENEVFVAWYAKVLQTAVFYKASDFVANGPIDPNNYPEETVIN